jgi:signal transduction histidine kinase
MDEHTYVVAVIGAGPTGNAVLEDLLDVPGLEVRYLFESDPSAPGIAVALEHDVHCRTDGRFDELSSDTGVDLVFETTGTPDVADALAGRSLAEGSLVGGPGVGTLARLLAGQCRAIADLTEVVQGATAEKARYLRQASHQIKSPLASIQSYVNVILEGYTGEIPDSTRGVVEKIHARCEAALAALAKRRLLADMRCVDRDALEPGTCRLGEAIAQAVERNADLAGAHGVEVDITGDAAADEVRCDLTQLVALLSELIENAVVYSHQGGLVEIAAAPDDGALAVSVRDQGIGIPERSLTRVFAEDYRADPAVKQYPDGVGLGLAIVKEIADLFGLEVSLESEEGRGSVFTVRVPLAPGG